LIEVGGPEPTLSRTKWTPVEATPFVARREEDQSDVRLASRLNDRGIHRKINSLGVVTVRSVPEVVKLANLYKRRRKRPHFISASSDAEQLMVRYGRQQYERSVRAKCGQGGTAPTVVMPASAISRKHWRVLALNASTVCNSVTCANRQYT
jgi:hypothetical protein